ncbi:cupin domain-containing protein [Ditylenchus destructor]|uniref:Cupin domain-containing protein n=1 Tax=Ditylenchus destructor TaxID=166010 RepID=A0AAD4QVE6_9BILA|nr:cupin domain-containing protein [Ditylenchus destructor]
MALALLTLVLLLAVSIFAEDDKPKPLYSLPLSNVPGKTITTFVLDYKPGAKSPPHRHGSSFVIAYVMSGEVRSKVNDGPVQVFKEGEMWTEQPGDHHAVAENASEEKPAKLLAVLIHESNDTNIFVVD